MEKWYVDRVDKILKEVERVLMEETPHARGVEIVVTMAVNEPTFVTYTIKEKVVR